MAIKTPTDPGQLRHRLTHQRFLQSEVDERGQPVGSWVDIGIIHAQREPLTGRLLDIARQVYERSTHRILVRYNQRLSINDRLQFVDQPIRPNYNKEALFNWLRVSYYYIGSIQDVEERHEWMELFCSEDTQNVEAPRWL